jgi:hypothetical protein
MRCGTIQARGEEGQSYIKANMILIDQEPIAPIAPIAPKNTHSDAIAPQEPTKQKKASLTDMLNNFFEE